MWNLDSGSELEPNRFPSSVLDLVVKSNWWAGHDYSKIGWWSVNDLLLAIHVNALVVLIKLSLALCSCFLSAC